jgi:hypothetical protein
VDEKKVSITDNISSVTISRTTAEKLQRKQPIVRKDSLKRDSDKPTDSEVQSMAVDQQIWTTARSRAEQIAANIVKAQSDDSSVEPSPEVKVKIRSTANKLIVINDDTTVTVYNTVDQATEARKAQREATQNNRSESTRG